MSENTQLKTLVILLVASLLLVLLGVDNKFNLLRWEALIVSSILAYASFESRRYYWGTAFVIFGLLFNPFVTPSLSRGEWIFADIALVTVLVGWFWDYFKGYHKGLLFEHHIRDKFPDHEWVIVSYTKDLHKKLRRFVESDANPDFVFRKRATGELIAVECKYRSEYWESKKWGEGVSWQMKQGERYAQYGKENNIPVYIALGVGGNPKSPKCVSYIPIELIQKQYFYFIPKKVLDQHQQHP